MIVTRTPRFLQQTFHAQRAHFSKRGFDHFRVLVVALLINARKSKLIHLAGAAPGSSRQLPTSDTAHPTQGSCSPTGMPQASWLLRRGGSSRR